MPTSHKEMERLPRKQQGLKKYAGAGYAEQEEDRQKDYWNPESCWKEYKAGGRALEECSH